MKPLFRPTPISRRGDFRDERTELELRLQKAEAALRMAESVVAMRNLSGFSTFLLGIDELREASIKLLILEAVPSEKSRLQGKVMALDAIIALLSKAEEAQNAHAKEVSTLQNLLSRVSSSKGQAI